MHNRFLDKKRRNPSLRLSEVKNVLPEHFASYYPKFIKLLEYYYTFQDENDSTELLTHLFATRDINETDITLLTYIEDELLLGETYFKGFGANETELRAAANFSSILFRSKGTKFAIEWFFRSFYGEDVEVIYPKRNIFKIGDSASTIGAGSLKYLTDDKLYQAFALLIKTGVPISQWREVFKLFSHPAGMYLGGEVAITDIVDVETFLQDLISILNPTPSYTLGGTTSANEGESFNILINGSNVDNGFVTGTDAVYWYGKHGSTSDSDFGINYYDGRDGLPDFNNPQYVEINNSTGSITVNTIIDPKTDPEESDEWFAIRIDDKEGNYLDSANFSLINLTESYSLTFPNSSILREGSEYTVNITGTNVPFAGTTSLKWYINAASSSANLRDSDFYEFYQNPVEGSQFYGLPDSARIGIPFDIVGGVGTFNLYPRVDGLDDIDETVAINLANVNNVDVGSGSFTIQNALPTLNVTVSDIIEGNNLIVQIETGAYNIGKTLNYEIIGDIAAENPLRIASADLTGSFLVTNTTMQISIPTIKDDQYNDATSGLVSGTFVLTDPNITVLELTATDTFNIQDAPAQYILTASESPGVEGNSITYIVNGSNIPNNTDVYFYVGPANPPNDANPAADWTVVMPQAASRAPITCTNNSGSITYAYASGDGVESIEYYEAYIYDQLTGGTKLAETTRLIVEVAPNIQVRRLSDDTIVSTIEETPSPNSYRIEIDASNLIDGQYFFYLESISGSYNSGDFMGGVNKWDDINEPDEDTAYAAYNQINPIASDPGGVKIVSNAGALEFYATEDSRFEGTETFRFILAQEVGGNLTTAASTTFSISDTSVPQYNFTAPTSLTEVDNYTIVAEPSAITGSDTLYFELSGTAASQYASSQATYVFDGADLNQIINVSFTTNGDNNIVESDRAGTISITRGDYASGSPTGTLFTQAFTLTDPQIIASNFIADPDTFDEGNSTTFRWNPGQYANDGITYWIRPTNVLPFIGNFDINNTNIVNVTPDPLAAFTSAGWVDNGSLVNDLKIFSSAGNQVGKATNASSTSITSTSTSSSTSTQTKFWIGRESEVWDYFDVTSNSQDVAGPITYVLSNGEGTRITTSAVNAAVTSDGIFTFGLYPNHTDQNGSELATEVVTISNISTGATIDLSGISGTDDSLGDFQFTDGTDAQGWLNDYEYEDQSQPAEAVAKMRFNPDGTYRVSTTGNYIGPNVTWANGSTGTGAGYWIRVREQNNSIDPTDNFSGISLNVWEELTTTKEFGVTASAQAQGQQQPSDQQTSTVQVYIDIVQAPSAAEANVIFANANANKDTKDVIMRAQAISIGF